MHEFYDDGNDHQISPEVELNCMILFDDVQRVVTFSPYTKTRKLNLMETKGLPATATEYLLEKEFPGADIEVFETTTTALYSSEKQKTAVIKSSSAQVDGDIKKALEIEFYEGAPFGYVFDESNDTQFEPRPGDIDFRLAPGSLDYNPVNIPARPLSKATAVWNGNIHAYSALDCEPLICLPQDDDDHIEDEIQPEQVASMILWLRKADKPIDILN